MVLRVKNLINNNQMEITAKNQHSRLITSREKAGYIIEDVPKSGVRLDIIWGWCKVAAYWQTNVSAQLPPYIPWPVRLCRFQF